MLNFKLDLTSAVFEAARVMQMLTIKSMEAGMPVSMGKAMLDQTFSGVDKDVYDQIVFECLECALYNRQLKLAQRGMK